MHLTPLYTIKHTPTHNHHHHGHQTYTRNFRTVSSACTLQVDKGMQCQQTHSSQTFDSSKKMINNHRSSQVPYQFVRTHGSKVKGVSRRSLLSEAVQGSSLVKTGSRGKRYSAAPRISRRVSNFSRRHLCPSCEDEVRLASLFRY